MEKENLKLSVIIPVYNVMTTLTRAVTSVLNQDLSVPYEITATIGNENLVIKIIWK